jgi:hypothetical protein
MEAEMVVVAVAFVIGGILGAVLTAALIARGQRALELTTSELDTPVRSSTHWPGEIDTADLPYTPDERIERFEQELARRLGREAAATARERFVAANHALRPGFGIMIRMKS